MSSEIAHAIFPLSLAFSMIVVKLVIGGKLRSSMLVADALRMVPYSKAVNKAKADHFI